MMKDFVFVYLDDTSLAPPDPEFAASQREKWGIWLAELGDAVVNPGTPFGQTMLVSSEGVTEGKGSTPINGFSVIRAESMDRALDMAKSCPFLVFGTIMVSEAMQM
jgi:hypothetical protein